MTTLVIDSADGAVKIQAIKEIRAITGYGLKESKEIIDRAAEGKQQELNSVRVGEKELRRLLDVGVKARLRGSRVRIDDVINIVARFPPNMTVSELECALEAMRCGVASGDLDPGEPV